MARYGKKASEKVEKVMREKKKGTLKSGGSGKKVTSRKQAIAIGLSEARKAGGKVPRKKSSAKKSTREKEVSARQPPSAVPSFAAVFLAKALPLYSSPRRSRTRRSSRGRRGGGRGMKSTILAVLLLSSGVVAGQTKAKAKAQPAPTLKSVLLEQLKTTHNVQDWFVPASKAVEGLTAEQAAWKQGTANHSIAQLVHHLIFWDTNQLSKFKGEKPAAYSGNNEDTFEPSADKKTWDAAVGELDEVMTAWEKAVETADDAKLQAWYSTIAHIGTHNAYHTGQILFIRKQQGSWDASKGVK